MPDADRNQPSARIHAPAGWGDAFAALPMETPPADGWQRVSRALDGPSRSHLRNRRGRWPVWLAAAATVSAIALVPVLMRESPPTDAIETARTTQPPATRPAQTTVPAAVPSAVATTPASVQDEVPQATAKAPAATPRKRRPSPTTPPHEAEPRRLIAAEGTPVEAVAAPDMPALHTLQAQSAQLEALVALARDDRVASASSAALTVELDERIGRIDASLSQPGLGDAERESLWRERVATMRELAGIETTRRWLTASGERYDGALVSVD